MVRYVPPMTVTQVVERHRDRLSDADERLVRELLASPTDAAFLSAAELAGRVGVHPATAVRLARKLGYSGYPELREAFRAELIDPGAPGERVRRRLADADGEVLASYVERERASLAELPRHLDQERLDAVARTLIAADRVYLFAHGHATGVLEVLDRRLRRSGFATVTLRGQGREIAERVVGLTDRDAVLAFALHAPPPGLSVLLGHAAAIGTPTVVITDVLGPLLRPQPTHVLAAPRGPGDQFQSLIVPLAIADALVLTIARLDAGRSIEVLDRLSGLIRRFEEEEGTR